MTERKTLAGEPIQHKEAATKKYEDDEFSKTQSLNVGRMDPPIDMLNHKITNLGTPTNILDAATKDYVDNLTSNDVNMN